MIADQEKAKPLPLIDTDNTDRKLGDLVIGIREIGRPTKKGRRFDHVFASAKLHATSASYIGEYLDQGLSDHAPLEVIFAPEILTAPDETTS